MTRTVKIKKINQTTFSGKVYNLHLKSSPDYGDDLFVIDGTGLVHHNCFPKDLNAIMFVARQVGVEPIVLQGVWDKNDEVRDNRDWEGQIGRAVSAE